MYVGHSLFPYLNAAKIRNLRVRCQLIPYEMTTSRLVVVCHLLGNYFSIERKSNTLLKISDVICLLKGLVIKAIGFLHGFLTDIEILCPVKVINNVIAFIQTYFGYSTMKTFRLMEEKLWLDWNSTLRGPTCILFICQVFSLYFVQKEQWLPKKLQFWFYSDSIATTQNFLLKTTYLYNDQIKNEFNRFIAVFENNAAKNV